MVSGGQEQEPQLIGSALRRAEGTVPGNTVPGNTVPGNTVSGLAECAVRRASVAVAGIDLALPRWQFGMKA